MKVLHIVSSFGAKSGGVSTCVYELLKGLRKDTVDAHVVSFELKDQSDRLMGQEEFIHLLSNDTISPFLYSKNMRCYLQNTDSQIIHANGMWEYPTHIACRIARKRNIPYLVSPHGMLYPQALIRSRLKKKFLSELFFFEDLNSATCLHATCREEKDYLRLLGYKNPIAVVPNAIDIPLFLSQIESVREKRRFGFLGRLHPRKNVHLLIEAFAELSKKYSDIELLIIGDGDAEYVIQLKRQVEQLSLKGVYFKGFVNGKEKFEELASLSCLVVPSDFENFGMIVTEALMVGTPVIASKGTPWEILERTECGWWVDNDIASLVKSMENVLRLSDDKIRDMGDRGRDLVNSDYSTSAVSLKMRYLYHWVVTNESKPEFVDVFAHE